MRDRQRHPAAAGRTRSSSHHRKGAGGFGPARSAPLGVPLIAHWESRTGGAAGQLTDGTFDSILSLGADAPKHCRSYQRRALVDLVRVRVGTDALVLTATLLKNKHSCSQTNDTAVLHYSMF